MRKIITLFTLCLALSAQPVAAQGFWDNIKEKATEWKDKATRKVSEKVSEKTANSEILDRYRYKVPITGRKFLNIIPDDYMLQMSSQQYRSFVRSGNLSSNSRETARVKKVSQRISAAVSTLYRQQGMSSELKGFKWEFNLIKGSDINAFCMPGGKICVYDAMMPVADTDDMLAVVIGHEVAHAMAKHSAEHLTDAVITTVGLYAVIAMIQSSDMSKTKKIIASAIASAGATLTQLKFSRIDEAEADRLGLILAAMAGYDPEAAIPFWKRMGEKTGDKSVHDFYSTHPSNTNRISNIQSYLPEAKSYYKKHSSSSSTSSRKSSSSHRSSHSSHRSSRHSSHRR